MNHNYKHIHYFSCNFEVHSNLDGETEEELTKLYEEALGILKAIVNQGTPNLELFETELAEEVLD